MVPSGPMDKRPASQSEGLLAMRGWGIRSQTEIKDIASCDRRRTYEATPGHDYAASGWTDNAQAMVRVLGTSVCSKRCAG